MNHGMNYWATSILGATLLSCFSCADAAAAANESGDHWSDRVSVNADFRLQWEGIYEDGRDDRERGRFRVRLGFKAEVNEDVRLIVRLATGGDNPVSIKPLAMDFPARTSVLTEPISIGK